MGHVDGERRLAHAADPGHRRHGHHPALGGGQHLAQLGHEGGPSREVGHGRRELGGADGHHRGFGHRGGGFGESRVGLEDALLQLAQFGAGVDAQLVRQQASGVGVHRQCLRLPAAAVQRQHQQLAQAFAQRVRGRQRRQLRDRLRVTAPFEVQVQPGLQELEPPLLQTDALRLRVGARHPGQRLPVPQGERLLQQLPGTAQVTGRARLVGAGRQVLGHRQVQRVLTQSAHGVPAGLADQHPGVQDLPQPGGVGAYRRQRPGGRPVAPQGVDQLGRGRGTALPQQQRGQQGALLRGAGGQRLLSAPGAYRPEYAEAQRRRLLGTPLLRYPRYTVHRCPLAPVESLSTANREASLPCSWQMRQLSGTVITGRRTPCHKVHTSSSHATPVRSVPRRAQSFPRRIGLVSAAITPGTGPAAVSWRTSART